MTRGFNVMGHVTDERAFRRSEAVGFQDAENAVPLVEHPGIRRFKEIGELEIDELLRESLAIHAGQHERVHQDQRRAFLRPDQGRRSEEGDRCADAQHFSTRGLREGG